MRKYLALKTSAPATYATYKNSGKPLSASPVSLRNLYGTIENQGQEGSCSSFSALQFRAALRKMAGLPAMFDPSEQAQYFEERELQGTVNQDSGATLEEALQVLEQFGVMPEQDDPYNPSTFVTDPSAQAWNPTLKLSADQVQHIETAGVNGAEPSTLEDTLDALNNGHPVYFGFKVFQGMESEQTAETGILPMPGPNEPLLGGHAVNAIGFNPQTQMILVLNQWGEDWGIKSPAELKGCFWMPYDYYQRYTTDAYVGFPDKYWYVQLAEFSDETKANVYLDEAESKGTAAFIKYVEGVTNPFKVLVGNYIAEADAVAEVPKMKDAGYTNASVVSY